MKTSRSAKVLALSSGKGLTAIIALISLAVLSRILSMEQYATYRQTILAYAFIAPLLSLGLPQALLYFLPTEKHRKRGLLIDNLLLLTITGMLFSIFLLSGGNQLLAWRFHNPELEETLKIFALYPIFMLPMGAIGACLVVQDRIKLLSVFNVLSRLFIVGLMITTCIIWKTASATIITEIATVTICSLIAIFIMLSTIPKDSWAPKLSSMKSILQYSIPLGLASMIGMISMQLDKFIVSSMCTLEEFSIFVNGAIEIPLISIITGSISSVILVDMRKLIDDNNIPAALSLFNQAAVKSATILFPTMVFLFVTATPFLTLIFSDKYSDSVLPFRLYLLLIPVRIVVFGAAFMALGKSKLILFRETVFIISNLVLSIILVNLFGYLGATIATITLIYLWGAVFNMNTLAKEFKCRFFETIPIRKIIKEISI